tara:strand:+ start:351 stop:644 length:294 start_codon:yes stop_codon:yes gene_type:complete
MAIIRYTLENGQRPSYISDGGFFIDPVNNTYIGIGSGGGTELTIAQLKAHALTARNNDSGMALITFNADGSLDECRTYTDSEIEGFVDAWCTEKGIS